MSHDVQNGLGFCNFQIVLVRVWLFPASHYKTKERIIFKSFFESSSSTKELEADVLNCRKQGLSRGREVLAAGEEAAAGLRLARAVAAAVVCRPRKRKASIEEWRGLQAPHYGAVCNGTMFWKSQTSVTPLLRP